MIKLKTMLVLAISFFISACGGDGSDSSSSNDSPQIDTRQVNGIYLGQGEEVGFGSYTIVALVNNGQIQAVSDTGVIYGGPVRLQEGDRFSSSLTLYDEFDNRRFGTASLGGNYVSERLLYGDYNSSSGAKGSFDLTYIPEIYERSASLDMISGTWMVNNVSASSSVTFDSNGGIFGTDSDGCVFSGRLVVPDDKRNLYQVSLTIESCGQYNGSYSGLGAMYSVSENDEFVAIATNSNYGFALDLIR